MQFFAWYYKCQMLQMSWECFFVSRQQLQYCDCCLETKKWPKSILSSCAASELKNNAISIHISNFTYKVYSSRNSTFTNAILLFLCMTAHSNKRNMTNMVTINNFGYLWHFSICFFLESTFVDCIVYTVV